MEMEVSFLKDLKRTKEDLDYAINALDVAKQTLESGDQRSALAQLRSIVAIFFSCREQNIYVEISNKKFVEALKLTIKILEEEA